MSSARQITSCVKSKDKRQDGKIFVAHITDEKGRAPKIWFKKNPIIQVLKWTQTGRESQKRKFRCLLST